MIEADQCPRAEAKNGKLPRRNQKVPVRLLDVEISEQITRQGVSELGSERSGMVGVVGHEEQQSLFALRDSRSFGFAGCRLPAPDQ
jgi:hypothetical protein